MSGTTRPGKWLAMAAALSLLLSACATAASPSSSAGTAGAPATGASTETSAPTPSPTTATDARRAYAGQTIRVLLDDVAPTTTMKQVIADFETATGIKVQLDVFDETTARQKIVLDLTSHTATYDVINLQWWFVPEFAKAGYLVPVNDLVASGTDPVWYNPTDFPGNILTGFKFNDTLYGLPFWVIGGMYYYRTDVFKELGIQPPKTLQDAITIAALAKSKGLYGWAGRGNRDFDAFGSFAGFASAYGAKLLDNTNHPTLLTDPAWKQAMTDWLKLMRDYGPPGGGNLTWYDAYQAMDAGKVLQFFETSDYGPSIENPKESKVVGNVGYVPAPVGPAGKPAQWFYSEGIGVNKDSKNQGAAWLFLQWRTSAETFAKELQVPDSPRFDVPSSSVLDSPEFDAAAQKAGMQAYANGLRETIKVADPWYWPAIPEYIKVAEAFASRVSAGIAGELTVDQILQQSNDAITKIMTDAGYYK
jgi:multiple sugar transport system substrate-binding protein/sorbitol/mannitol transport system substrate-binding protein